MVVCACFSVHAGSSMGLLVYGLGLLEWVLGAEQDVGAFLE